MGQDNIRFREREWELMGKKAEDAVLELWSAQQKFPKFNSAHEGFAVLKEEVDELWEEVKKNPSTRDNKRLRAEAVQVAAMALRFIDDVCGGL